MPVRQSQHQTSRAPGASKTKCEGSACRERSAKYKGTACREGSFENMLLIAKKLAAHVMRQAY